MPPWEKYQTQGESAGPWAKYAARTAGDYVQSLGSGVNRGLLNMAQAPAQLANVGLRAAGVDYQFPDMVESARGTEIGERMLNPGAQDMAGRALGRVGEEIGASVLPAAAITGAATRTAAAAKGLWGAFANPIRNAPGRAAVGELAAATGAGAGGAVAQEAAPDSGLAETTGQVVGGLAPAILAGTPTALATRAIRGVARRVSPQAQREAGREAVQDMMGQELSPEAGQRLSEAERLRKEIPGFEPSLGEATGSQALIAQQKRIEGQASGRDLDALTARRRGSEEAIDAFATRSGPEGAGGPEFVVDTASRRIDDLRGEISKRGGEITAAREGLAGRLSTTDRAAVGEGLRRRMLDVRTEARQALNARASDLGINDVDLTVPFGRFRSELVREFQPQSVFEDAANQPAVLDLLRSMPQPREGGKFAPERVTFADVKALRERIGDDLMDAMGSSDPNRRKVRTLTLMREKLDNFINGLSDSEFREAADNWKGFRKEYFEQYIDRFEKGAAFKVRQKDGRGFYRTPDEKVATAFFEPGNVSAARQFRSVFGNDPEALAHMEATALDSLRDSAVRDGVIQPRLFETWARKHRSVLDEFPGLSRAVDSVEAADQGLLARQAQLEQRSRAVEDQFLTRELTAFSKGTRTPESVVDAALKDPRKMRQLQSILRDRAEAINALRRSVWDDVAGREAEDIARYIGDNRKSLSLLFSRNHVSALNDIMAARMMLERTPTPQGAAFVPRPLAEVESIIGQGLPQISSRIFAFKSGRMQKGYLAVDTFMRGMRGRAATAADAVLREALYDPALARDLANTVKAGQMVPERAKRLQARLFALGLPYLEQGEDQTQ